MDAVWHLHSGQTITCAPSIEFASKSIGVFANCAEVLTEHIRGCVLIYGDIIRGCVLIYGDIG